MKPLIRFTVLLGLLLLWAGPLLAQDSEAAYFPTEEWRTATPEAQGLDSLRLIQMFDYLQRRNLDMHSILIVRHGYLVMEAYFYPFQADLRHDIASGAKSVISTLVGIAVDQGFIDGVQHPLLSYFPNRTVAHNTAQKQRITLENALTMTAGLAWDEWRPMDSQNTSVQMSASADPYQFVLDRPMSDDPGTRWNYNSGLPVLFGPILYDAVQEDLRTFAQQNFLEPVGMDADLQFSTPGNLRAVALTPRDMAKYGYLYLQHGVWDGQQVLSSEWVQASTEPHVTTSFDSDYGYFWWLPSYGGYAASGDGGQQIIVIPDEDLVVVFTAGLTYPDMHTVPDELVQSYILPAIQSSDPLPENPEANAQMAARLEAIAQPDPKPATPLPAVASDISGKTYALNANSIGLKSFRLDFTGSEASLSLSFGGRPQPMAIGLDNTYRFTSLEPDGPIYGWMALKGAWREPNAFVLHLLMSGVARNFIFQFRDDKVTVWYQGSRGEQELIPGTLRN